MSFSGSLAEFDISNIFLLIEQDSATGELIIVTNDERYVISFKNGQLVNARSERESIRRFIFIYLKQVKGYSGMEIKELDTIFHNNSHLLSEELLKKGYMDQKEMSIIVQSGIIDITSIVFGIKKGNYIFDTKPNMDAAQFLTLSIPANFVLLESARKVDEAASIGSIITDDTIFDSTIHITPQQVHEPVSNFSLYALSHVDGAQTVRDICDQMFFSSCHVFTALDEAHKAGKITLLNTPDTPLKPLKQKVQREGIDNGDIVMASTITGILSLALFLIGVLVFRGNLWRPLIMSQRSAIHTQEIVESQTRLQSAQLLYQGIHYKFPLSYKPLLEEKLIEQRDIELLRYSTKKDTAQ